MKFKYKTSFTNEISASAKVDELHNLGISEASLNSLKGLIPKDIDLEKNIDLIGVAFNAAVVNRFNKNGDGISTDTALSIKDYFVNKPTNIEHHKEKVVGHIVSSSFSDFNNSNLLTDDQVKNLKSPFNIALAAVVYKTVNKKFASLLEDDEEQYDEIISASWELGFNDYYLALGSKNLDEAEIVTDPKQIYELSRYLRTNDGSGETADGVMVNRLIVGEIFPLGIAFTTNPAAEVKGVYVDDPYEEKESEESDAEENNLKKINEKSSQSDSLVVNLKNNYTLMESDIIQKFEEMLSEKLSNQQFSDEAVANVARVFHDAIRQKDEEYKADREEKEKEYSEAQEANEKLSSDIESLKEQLEATQVELNSLKEEKELALAEEMFNSRMSILDDEFQLADEDRIILASEVKELDSAEEAFASYQEKLRVMWSHKTKAFIEAREKEIQERINEEVSKRLSEAAASEPATSEVETVENTSEASEVEAEEVLDNVEETAEVLTNNNAEAAVSEQSLRDKFRGALNRENLTIKL